MKSPENHVREEERLALLESYAILDTLPESDYDNLTKLAAEICDTPISVVTLLDSKRQWFKSHHGLTATETPKEYAFCAHAINSDDNVFMVENARADERFIGNPLVEGDPNVIFYAGVSLKGSDGLPLGTLCVIDHETRSLSSSQIEALHILADQVMNLLELRKSKMQLEAAVKILERNNEELERFADVAAHDLRSPLNNIGVLIGFLEQECGSDVTEKGKQIITHIQHSTETLKKFIDGLLEYSRSATVLQENKSTVDVEALRNSMAELFSSATNCSITSNSDLKYMLVNSVAVEQILINLVSNAINYNDKASCKIVLGFVDLGAHYEISVADNGPGIPEKHRKKIFELFQTLSTKDRYGRRGTGMGLATVKRMVQSLGGTISVDSKLGEGAKFTFTVAK
ncbi:MAG: GAF domain-containing sensor histidine kinase [Pricia sp.]|nr:GAF domain-containing sensor histidine kinase [Pricia sp.]